MANIVIPTIIQGPAFIKVNATVLYVQKDISVNQQVESWNPDSYMGPLGERHKSRKDVLSFTPVGIVASGLLDFFYASHLSPGTTIGRTIIAGTVTIASIAENKTYVWQRGGMTKPPSLLLKPTATAYGAMEVTCIGKAATQPTDAVFWHAAEGVPPADTSFDQTAITSDIYSAALGARATPFDAMGGIDGFELDFGFSTKDIAAGDLGIADIVLDGISLGVKFAPSNLTEAQADTLLALQGADAVLPGQAFAKAGEDLVITGTQIGWTFTAARVGAKSGNRIYQIGEHRFRELVFANERTWTTGVADALFAYTVPA